MKFIKNMLFGESSISSKRFVGVLIILIEVVVIGVCTICTIPISPALVTLHQTLIYVSGTLLGITVFKKIKFNSNKDVEKK